MKTKVNKMRKGSRDCFVHLHTNKLDNLEAADKCPRNTQFTKIETRRKRNRKPKQASEKLRYEMVIKNLPINKNIGLNGFTIEFYQTVKKELISVLFKAFQT